MKDVAILGLSGDPVHFGHIAIAEALTEYDEVWLMPCYDHMFSKKLSDAVHRIAMCELATLKFKKIKVCDFEISQQVTGGTYKVLSAMRETYGHNFSFVIGQDNAACIDKWINYDQLLNEFRFIIVPRVDKDNQIDSLSFYLKHFAERPIKHPILVADIPSVSSTEIRNKIKNNESVENYLDESVIDYIRQHKLYQ